ncbi:hypothetical protein E2C01_044704 [Portunus trituberculatus]|uniref:Uncharacterized protein n=1 Tax=Portunus trituberculatus TaxID=210409 RepID=A0A5B7FST4_PORTR|nr:hypothetical protein [Portunus trituberculatus]
MKVIHCTFPLTSTHTFAGVKLVVECGLAWSCCLVTQGPPPTVYMSIMENTAYMDASPIITGPTIMALITSSRSTSPLAGQQGQPRQGDTRPGATQGEERPGHLPSKPRHPPPTALTRD